MAIKFHLEPGALGRLLRTLATLLIVGSLGYVLYVVTNPRPAPRPIVITTIPTAPVVIEKAPEVSAPVPLPDLPPPPPIGSNPDLAPKRIEPILPPLRGPDDVKPVRPLKSGKTLVRKDAPPRAAPRRPVPPRAAPVVPERQTNLSTATKIAQRTNPPSQAQLNLITGQWLIWPGDASF